MRQGWQARLLSAVGLLLLVAGGLRVAYWLLAPAVPWLLVVGGLLAIFAFLLGQRR